MNNYMNLGVTALLALINKIRKINSNKYNNVRIFFLCLAVNNYVFDDISSKKKRNVLKSCVTNVHSKKKTVKRAKNMNRMGWYNVLQLPRDIYISMTIYLHCNPSLPFRNGYQYRTLLSLLLVLTRFKDVWLETTGSDSFELPNIITFKLIN